MNNDTSKYSCTIIRIQDILLILISSIYIINRNVPIDCSSLWQWGILIGVYVIVRFVKYKYRKYILGGVLIWGVVETTIVVLQKHHWLESNHHSFNVTGTFGNPGPLGGLLAICLLISIYSIFNSLGKKKNNLTLLYVLVAVYITYAAILSESRSGWIASCIGGVCLIFHRFKNNYFVKSNLALLKIIISFFVISFFVAIYFLKKDSADGRLFIWSNTLDMIMDRPIFGFGTGGWLSNYMLYQADYFLRNPESDYMMLADNAFYPYNEFLHIIAEQGLIGFLFVMSLFYVLFTSKDNSNENYLLKVLLTVFLVFSFFSYPGSVFLLQLLFIVLIGMIRSYDIKRIYIPLPKRSFLGSLFVLCLFCISVWSYRIYNEVYKALLYIEKPEKNVESASSPLHNLYPFFRFNPQLMDLYSQSCETKYFFYGGEQILYDAARLVPTCELYSNMGDLWSLKNDIIKAEKYYQTASAMIPHRLTPKYNLFKLYIKQGNKKSACYIGYIILKQSVKKEGTRTLRMRAEVEEYLRKENQHAPLQL